MVVADFVADVNGWRITTSVPLLNRGRTVAFLVRRHEKAEVLGDVVLGRGDAERLPAQLIAPEGELLWMVDEAAATQLSRVEERGTA